MKNVLFLTAIGLIIVFIPALSAPPELTAIQEPSRKQFR